MRMHEMESVAIFQPTTESEFDEARRLFQEYAHSLGVDLCFQNFEQELEKIREIYGAPGGCLLLARRNDNIIGCVAFRRAGGICVAEFFADGPWLTSCQDR